MLYVMIADILVSKNVYEIVVSILCSLASDFVGLFVRRINHHFTAVKNIHPGVAGLPFCLTVTSCHLWL